MKEHPKSKTLFNREVLVSWLFTIGSLLFLVDGFIELSEGISIHVLLHLTASVLFVFGSVLFIPRDRNNSICYQLQILQIQKPDLRSRN